MDIKKLPKIELHLHLDGSISIDTASQILNKSKETLKGEMVAKEKCLDLNEYLTKFSLPVSIMQTKEQLLSISKDLIKQLKNDNVIYAEVRFAPIKHTTILSLEEVVETVIDGLKNNDVKINLILCMMRDSSYIDNLKIIDLANKYLNKGVVAIDLAGAEGLYKTSLFENLFKYANQLSIPFTIHAGEADGIDSIKSAISFGAKRIGHGIRLIDDKKFYDVVKDNNIMLEICPTSNVQTNAVLNYSSHPIKDFYKNNILISINTDNRTVSNTTLDKEYNMLMTELDFNIDDFIKINLDSIKYSFMNHEEKIEMMNKYLNKLEK